VTLWQAFVLWKIWGWYLPAYLGLPSLWASYGAMLAVQVFYRPHSVAMFAEVPTSDGDPGDLDYFVADALAGKLENDHRLLREKWKRLFDLTRRVDGGTANGR
jgi:hypothetical protein